MEIKEAREQLRFAGMMGHEFVTLRENGHIGLHCNSAKRAREYIKENGGTAYQKINGQWNEIL